MRPPVAALASWHDTAHEHLPGVAGSEYEECVVRHARHYVSRLVQAAAFLYGDAEQGGLRQLVGQVELSLELGNILEALDSACRRELRDMLECLAEHLWLPLEIAGEFRLMQQTASRLTELSERLGWTELHFRSLMAMAWAQFNLGEHDAGLATVGAAAANVDGTFIQGSTTDKEDLPNCWTRHALDLLTCIEL